MGEDWQEGKCLSECNLHMLTHEIACDVTFLVGEREEVVMAHTFIIESRAPKLSRLFADQKKFSSKLILIPDVPTEPFRLKLRYLYTGDADLTTQQALSLIPVVQIYGPQSLTKTCFEQVLSELASHNACDILEKCHKYKEKFFFNKCLHFINVNAREVMMSRGFRQMCRTCLESIVSSDELNTDESSVFYALISWADSQCSKGKLQPIDANRRQKLGSLIFHVRFITMSITEFTEKVSVKYVLTSDEKIKIFQYHHGTRTKLPPHFMVTPRKVYNDTSQQLAHDFGEINVSASITPNTFKDNLFQSLFDRNNTSMSKVNRFQTIDGTWKNNGPDAIKFKCSYPIFLHGIKAFSRVNGTKTFHIEVTIFDQSGTKIYKENVPAECRDESRLCDILLTDPVRVPAKQLYTIQTYSNGSPVHCGTDGVTPVIVDGVRFDFVASSKSLNGTDVTIGQIPVLLFTKR